MSWSKETTCFNEPNKQLNRREGGLRTLALKLVGRTATTFGRSPNSRKVEKPKGVLLPLAKNPEREGFRNGVYEIQRVTQIR